MSVAVRQLYYSVAPPIQVHQHHKMEQLEPPAESPRPGGLPQLHDSVVNKLLALLDTRSKCALMCTCTQYLQLVERQEHWTELAFDTATEQHGLAPAVLFSLLRRSQGACEVIQLARSEEARAAEGQQRFSAGYKRDEVLPHTKGLRAYALAALCPKLRHLSMDERASCVGGMTNDMARALAVHCKQLRVLEVYFQRYSLPSELFTDEGLIALSEGCRQLRHLTLHNCDRISDRSMYALAANCPDLEVLMLGGYNEHVTDGGMTVLFEACKHLHTVKLSSKLLKVLIQSCTLLTKLVLPERLNLEPLLEGLTGRSHTLTLDEEEQRQVLQLQWH